MCFLLKLSLTIILVLHEFFVISVDNGVSAAMDTCVTSVGFSTSETETCDERNPTNPSLASEDSCFDSVSKTDLVDHSDTPPEVNNGDAKAASSIDNKKHWGVLNGPVRVKIADLGNACWVVSYIVTYRFTLQWNALLTKSAFSGGVPVTWHRVSANMLSLSVLGLMCMWSAPLV